MMPFAVRLEVATPLRLAGLFHLDGLLAWAAVRRGGSAGRLPLRRTAGVWHASAALLETGPFGAVEEPLLRVKSLRPEAREALAEQGATSMLRRIGPMSPLRPRLAAHTRTAGVTALWFTGEGDVRAVATLLEEVEALGGFHQVGYGARTAAEPEFFAVTVPGPAGLVLAGGLPARAVPLAVWDGLGLARHPRAPIGEQSWQPDYRTARWANCIGPPPDLRGTWPEMLDLIGG